MCMFCTFHVPVYFLLCCNASAIVICAIKNYLFSYLYVNNREHRAIYTRKMSFLFAKRDKTTVLFRIASDFVLHLLEYMCT